VRFNSLDPRAIRATRQVSGHDFSVLLEPSEAMRKQRSRAVQALKNISLRRRPSRSWKDGHAYDVEITDYH
jgi:hypothetical protein